MPRQQLSVECARCGRKVGAMVNHYQVVVCPCGWRYWALEPKRDGPMVLVPHDASNLVPPG